MGGMGTGHICDLDAIRGEVVGVERRRFGMDVDNQVIAVSNCRAFAKSVDHVNVVSMLSDAFGEFLHLPDILMCMRRCARQKWPS